MKIRIYQINLERDTEKVAFMALDTLPKFQKTEGVNSALYDRVYEADVDCFNLEDVFRDRRRAGNRGWLLLLRQHWV